MLLFWVMLHVLQGNALVPVATVQLRKPVTFTCDIYMDQQSMDWLYLYKQTAGDTLKLILMLHRSTTPIHGPGFSSSRFKTTYDDKLVNLTILEAAIEDEGMYHCAVINWDKSAWNGTYLQIEGNTDTTSSYHVVQQPAVLDPSRPADSDTLQCFLLSQPQVKSCSGDPSVFWVRAKTDKSFPDVIYTDGKTPENCEKTSNTQKRCRYNFSKKVAPSDVGTYYCAVATCGEILLGDRTKVEIAHSSSDMMLLVTTGICLAICTVVNIGIICGQTQRSSCKNGWTPNRRELKTEESVYSNVIFSPFEMETL